jgi:hypothetical protein
MTNTTAEYVNLPRTLTSDIYLEIHISFITYSTKSDRLWCGVLEALGVLNNTRVRNMIASTYGLLENSPFERDNALGGGGGKRT